jgi:hypothetical protein
VATITSGGLIQALAIGTSTIRATFTPTTGQPTIVEISLTVLTPPALTLAATPTTVVVGQALSVTVTSARVAGFGGLPVTITSTGTGAVSHATIVTILENQTSAQFVVSGVTVGPVTLTATAPIRIPGTLALTVLPAPPTIAGFTPITGTIGTSVTLTGTNLNGAGPGTTTVRFNATDAIITSVSARQPHEAETHGAGRGPDSLRSLGIGGIDFERDDQGWVFPQAEGRGRFAVEMQDHGFCQIGHGLINRLALRDHCDFETLSHIARLLTRSDDGFNRLLQVGHGRLSCLANVRSGFAA